MWQVVSTAQALVVPGSSRLMARIWGSYARRKSLPTWRLAARTCARSFSPRARPCTHCVPKLRGWCIPGSGLKKYPLPATASAEGRLIKGTPFPTSATAEGAQFNVPPFPATASAEGRLMKGGPFPLGEGAEGIRPYSPPFFGRRDALRIFLRRRIDVGVISTSSS